VLESTYGLSSGFEACNSTSSHVLGQAESVYYTDGSNEPEGGLGSVAALAT
jgi:hypothetical protein